MAKYLKQMMAEELRGHLDESPNCLVVGLKPMDAETDVALRNKLRDHGARLRVIPNRVSRYAFDDARKGLADLFVGPTAIALVPQEDPDMVVVAKALFEAQKGKSLELRGGFVEGEILDKSGVEFLANSPDKQTLRGMLAGAIIGTARGLAVALNGVGEGLARCLQQRIDESNEVSGETPSE